MAKIERKQIEQSVIETVVNILAVDPESVKSDTQLKELGADSLDEVEIIMELERKFGIDITDDMYTPDSCKVSDVCDILEKKLKSH